MKKIISTLITLALLLNFAAFDVSAAPAKNTKRDSMLSALGILDEVYPDDYLTRDRYAEAIVSCFGYDKSNIDLATTLEFFGVV